MEDKLDIQLSYVGSATINEESIAGKARELAGYIEFLNKVVQTNSFEENESSLNLPDHEKTLEDVKLMASQKITRDLKYVLVVGVGGSNLGAQAIYEAVYGKEYNYLEHQKAELIFLDTVSPTRIKNIRDLIANEVKTPDQILINMISKSGTTNETVANFEIIYDFIQEILGDADDRYVITTDKETQLWKDAYAKDPL